MKDLRLYRAVLDAADRDEAKTDVDLALVRAIALDWAREDAIAFSYWCELAERLGTTDLKRIHHDASWYQRKRKSFSGPDFLRAVAERIRAGRYKTWFRSNPYFGT